MKTRHWSFISLAAAYAFLSSAPALVGCSSGGSSGTAGTSGGGSGGSGGGGGSSSVVLDPMNLISDFEDPAAATIVMAGTPPRNGYWYTYNDDNPKGTDSTCVQDPKSGPQNLPDPPLTYFGSAPPSAAAG